MAELPERYITQPIGIKLFHVFKRGDGTSLCGSVLLLRPDPEACDAIKGNEKYVKGQDCKACFRKAGLNTGA